MDNNEEKFSRDPIETLELDTLPDDFLDEVDRELDALTAEPIIGATDFQLVTIEESKDGLSNDPGVREMQLTFVDLARNSLGPVTRYMKALTQGESFRELLEMSEMVVTPLLPKIEDVGLQKHADDLTFFRSLLYLALGERDQDAMEAMREVVMEGYTKLSERFGLNYRGYRLAVRNLVQFYKRLRQTEGVSELDVRKFFAIGVPSLTWVRRTKVNEMTSLSGISPEAMAKVRKLAYICQSVAPIAGASLARDEDIPPESWVEQDINMGDLTEMDVLDSEVLDAATTQIRQPRGTA